MVCHQRSIIRNSLKENEAQGNLKGPKVPLDPPTGVGLPYLSSCKNKRLMEPIA